MIKNNLQRWKALLPVLSCALLLLSACETTRQTENSIEKRAMARWHALLSEDFSGAYEFLSPGYRSSVSFVQYQKSILLQKVKWTDASYIESNCTETSCKVKISLDFTVIGAIPGVNSYEATNEIEESWVLSGNKWYFVPRH